MPCVATHPDDHGILGNIRKQPFEEIWTGQKAKNFRHAHLHNESQFSPCHWCHRSENEGRTNRRDEFETRTGHLFDQWVRPKEELEDPQNINSLDIAFSNVCNLACTMCSSKYSTPWFELETKLKSQGFHRKSYKNVNVPFEDYRKNISGIFPYLNNLRYLFLKGGEPLLSRECLWFLDELVQRGLAGQIRLMLITNGTILNKKILSLFERFKVVEVVVSLDAEGDLFQYIRGGDKAEFSTVVENIQKFREIGENVRVVISPTLQAYNALRFYDLIKFSHSICNELVFKNWVIEPVYQSVVSLPEEVFPEVLSNLEKSIDFLNDVEPKNKSILYLEQMKAYIAKEVRWRPEHMGYKSNSEQFLRYTKIIDSYRGTKLAHLEPKLAKYLI